MSDLDTDRQWELWGRQRPYFGVLVSHEYDRVQRGDTAWHDFMRSGDEHVEDLFDALARLGGPDRLDRALDFGCGVGRLLPPLSSRFREVVGMDVSASMRAEAVANLAMLDVPNVEVVPSDDELSPATGRFDLVHSYNVLQHIAPRRGLALTERLLDLTRPGGAVVLHYCDHAPSLRHRVKRVARHSRRATRLANRVRGAAPDAPVMQMFPYRFDDVTALLRRRGVEDVLVRWSRVNRNTFFQVHAVLPGP